MLVSKLGSTKQSLFSETAIRELENKMAEEGLKLASIHSNNVTATYSGGRSAFQSARTISDDMLGSSLQDAAEDELVTFHVHDIMEGKKIDLGKSPEIDLEKMSAAQKRRLKFTKQSTKQNVPMVLT